MKKGELKTTLRRLEEKGGEYSGNSLSILRALSFNGKWSEFLRVMGDNVQKTEKGMYVVKHPEFIANTEEVICDIELDPESFALCAANYVLGEGNDEEFEPLNSSYDSLPVIVGHLAIQIDPEIGTLNYPYDYVEELEVYQLERFLMYSSNGNGLISFFGKRDAQQVAA